MRRKKASKYSSDWLRVLGLAEMGRLRAEFALPAGYGDVTVGLLALVSVYALVNHKPYARALAIGVNIRGILDFVIAFADGLASIGPFVLQLEAIGITGVSQLCAHLPVVRRTRLRVAPPVLAIPAVFAAGDPANTRLPRRCNANSRMR